MLRRLVIASSVVLAAQAHAGQAGKIIFSAGHASIAERAAAEGAPVQEGELLATGADGYLYIKTVDNGLFILRPNTQARIAAYHVDDKTPANTRVKLELLSGTARSKSGDAVKLARQNFRFNTPVAAIGVRGTDFTVTTDQNISRVSVLTGGVVVSGFGGACRPEGLGPCEGATSRELSAAQRGQLLQVQRGQVAPQLLQGNGPDQVAPPRADEPLAKTGAAEPALDAQKNQSLNQSLNQTVVQQPPVITPPPLVTVPPPVTPPTTPDVPVTPPLPEREITWGRWAPLAGKDANISLTGPVDAERIIDGNFVLFRAAGKEYVTPERGSVSFALKNSEAYVHYADPEKAAVAGQLQNGKLDVDFGNAMFVTSFDLKADGQTFKLMADGPVASSGRFGNNPYVRPETNNMMVDGMLSNAGGGTAAYLFHGRLDDTRTVNGATAWAR